MAKPQLFSGLHRLNILISQTSQPKIYMTALKWLISSGKFFVVVVEIIVIAGFIYRFKLDADLAELQDKIKEQIPYIQSLQGTEIEMRHLQSQITTIKNIRQGNADLIPALTKIAALVPKNARLNNITMDKTQSYPKTSLRLIGEATSNYEVSSFLKTLQKDPQFQEMVLANISFEKQLINFTITGTIINTSNPEGGS